MNELCEECKEFDQMMNGGPVSFDVFVICEHKKHNQPERLNPEDQCKHKWEEEEMRGHETSKFFCSKCYADMR